MTQIIKKIVSTGNGSKFNPPNPVYFAVHSTANPGATAANHVNYWTNNPRKAVHMVSDWKEAYQCVDFQYRCNQVGNGNYTCIGLEICEAKNVTDFMQGLEIARSVILQTLDKYGWTVDGNVRSHLWFTNTYGGSDHTDPIPYFARYGWTWNQFIQFLKDGEGDDDMPKLTDKIKAADGKEYPYETFIVQDNDKINKINKALTEKSDYSGRGSNATLKERVDWIGANQQKILANQEEILKLLKEK